jgi:NADPH2:quinone reductase
MKYRRVVLTRFGKPTDAFQIVEDDLPEPNEGQVRVKILAPGVAYADVMMRHGVYPGMPRLPFTPGYDMVGVIDAVGTGVRAFSPGQIVAALTFFGSYSQYVCLSTEYLVVVPEGVDSVEASCLPLNYLTAYQLLYRVANVKSGQSILVYGAAGGVGTALLQLGKLAGLHVYGTASSLKQELVTQLGAIPLDYKKEDVVARVRALTGGGWMWFLMVLAVPISLNPFKHFAEGATRLIWIILNSCWCQPNRCYCPFYAPACASHCPVVGSAQWEAGNCEYV